MNTPETYDSVLRQNSQLPVADPPAVRRHVAGLLKRHRGTFTAVILLNSVAALAALVGPQVLGRIVQGVTEGLTSGEVNKLTMIFLAALVVQTIFTRWARLRAAILGEWILADLREDLIKRAVGTPARCRRAGGHRRPGEPGDHRRRPVGLGRPDGRTRDDDRHGHRAARRWGTHPHGAAPGARRGSSPFRRSCWCRGGTSSAPPRPTGPRPRPTRWSTLPSPRPSTAAARSRPTASVRSGSASPTRASRAG